MDAMWWVERAGKVEKTPAEEAVSKKANHPLISYASLHFRKMSQ